MFLILEIEDMEAALAVQIEETLIPSAEVAQSAEMVRSTRGVDVSRKYASLLSKKSCKIKASEATDQNEMPTVSEVPVRKVSLSIY